MTYLYSYRGHRAQDSVAKGTYNLSGIVYNALTAAYFSTLKCSDAPETDVSRNFICSIITSTCRNRNKGDNFLVTHSLLFTLGRKGTANGFRGDGDGRARVPNVNELSEMRACVCEIIESVHNYCTCAKERRNL